MKTKFTLLLMLGFLAGLASAQEKKKKSKKQIFPGDSVYAYKFVPKDGSDDLLLMMMPVDSVTAGNVKMPNSYRPGLTEPVPMPTHRINLVKPKRKADSVDKK